MNKSKKSLRLLLAVFLLGMIFFVSACTFGNTSGGSFSVALNLNGGEGLEASDFIVGNKLVEPATTPTKKGCEFLGWFYEADFETKITFNVQITKNITIYAKWSEIAWTVTFVYGGDIVSVKEKVADKGKAIVPSQLPIREGYAISGWYKNSEWSTAFSFTETIEDDISIYAKWDIANYDINYHFDSGLPHINTVYSYTINNAVTLASPTREGYDFLGWYDNAGFEGSPVTTIVKGSSGVKDFYAKYICFKNDIERTMLGANITADTITINVNYLCESLILNNINIIVSDRATFVVTSDTDVIYEDNIITMPDAPEIEDDPPYVEVKAKIEVTSEKGTVKVYTLTINKYAQDASVTVSYDTSVASSIGEIEIPIFTKTTEPVLNAVVGYTFDGWYNENNFLSTFDFDSLVGSDKTIYAKFTPISYNISYNVGVGKNNASNVSTYTLQDNIDFSDALGTDLYNFAGWYADKNFVETIDGLTNKTGDISIFAKYNLKVDNSAMALNYSGSQNFTSEQNYELTKYLEYVVYDKSGTASFTLDLVDANYDIFIQNAWKNIEIPKSTMNWNASRSENYVTMTFTYSDYPDNKASVDDKYTQLSYLLHEEYDAVRAVDFDDFKVNSIANKVAVSSSEMLFYVLSKGYRPMPTVDSNAERIYNKAKVVLRNIVDDSMSETEKLHKIYDWIIMNVVYDKELFDLTILNNQTAPLQRYNGFYLEGVFDDHRAVCDGISKALAVLARIEGIEAYQVIYSPEDASVGHAWNKVKVDGNYYIIDATSGGTIISDDEVLTHKYFMLTDIKFKELTVKDTEFEYFAGYEGTTHSDKVAQTDYNVYLDIVIIDGETSFDMVITSQEELNILLEIYKNMKLENATNSFTIDAYINFDYGEELSDEITEAVNLILPLSYSFSFDKGYLILIFFK